MEGGLAPDTILMKGRVSFLPIPSHLLPRYMFISNKEPYLSVFSSGI